MFMLQEIQPKKRFRVPRSPCSLGQLPVNHLELKYYRKHNSSTLARLT